MRTFDWISRLIVGAFWLSACDSFFEIDATVTACDSGLPLEGVLAVVHLDKGYGEKDHQVTTDSAGMLSVTLNEPDSVVATLTLTKPGFAPLTKQFDGEPKEALQLCLSRAP